MAQKGDEGELTIFENDLWRICFTDHNEGFVEAKFANNDVNGESHHNRVGFIVCNSINVTYSFVEYIPKYIEYELENYLKWRQKQKG